MYVHCGVCESCGRCGDGALKALHFHQDRAGLTHRGAVDTFDLDERVRTRCVGVGSDLSGTYVSISTTWVRWVEYLIVLDRYRELVWYCSVHGACVWTEERPWSCLDSTKTHAQPHYVIYKQVHLYVLRRHTFKTVSKRPCFQFLLFFFFTHHTEFGRKTAQSPMIAVEAVWIVKSTTCHLKMYARCDQCLKQNHWWILQLWWSCLLSKKNQTNKKKLISHQPSVVNPVDWLQLMRDVQLSHFGSKKSACKATIFGRICQLWHSSWSLNCNYFHFHSQQQTPRCGGKLG